MRTKILSSVINLLEFLPAAAALAQKIFEHNEGTRRLSCKDGRTNTSRVCKENVPDAKYARLHYKVIHTDTLPSGEPFSQLEIYRIPGVIIRSACSLHMPDTL